MIVIFCFCFCHTSFLSSIFPFTIIMLLFWCLVPFLDTRFGDRIYTVIDGRCGLVGQLYAYFYYCPQHTSLDILSPDIYIYIFLFLYILLFSLFIIFILFSSPNYLFYFILFSLLLYMDPYVLGICNMKCIYGYVPFFSLADHIIF